MPEVAPSGSGRDELSRTLRALRAAAGLTQAEAGTRAKVGQHAVSRFERGLYLPTPDEAAALAGAYRAPAGTRDRLRQMAEDLHSQDHPRRVVLQRGVANFQQRIARIEAAAEKVRSFHPSMVIGALQSPAYARAVFAADADVSEAEAQAAVAARLDRQRALDEPGRRFTLIQTEGALRWQVSSPELMVEQLELIGTLATAGNARVGIIPWTVAATVVPPHAFHIYDRRAAVVGTKTATAVLTDPLDVEVYDALFAQFERLAVFGTDARQELDRIADEYRALRG